MKKLYLVRTETCSSFYVVADSILGANEKVQLHFIEKNPRSKDRLRIIFMEELGEVIA